MLFIQKYFEIKDPSSTPWTNASLFRVPEYPNYLGRPTALSNTSLSLFTNWMIDHKNNIKYSYDYAVAFMKYLIFVKFKVKV